MDNIHSKIELRTTGTCLVADKHDDDIAAPFRSNIVNPFARLLKGIHVGDVVDDYCHSRIANVTEKTKELAFQVKNLDSQRK